MVKSSSHLLIHGLTRLLWTLKNGYLFFFFLTQMSIFYLGVERQFSLYRLKLFILRNRCIWDQETNLEQFCFYVRSFLRKISLFHPSSFLLPLPESSVGVTFGLTGVLSDVVNEIQRHHDPDPFMALDPFIHLLNPTG